MQGILRVADLTQQRVDQAKQLGSVTITQKQEMQTKLSAAKICAVKEIKEIREKTEAFCKFLDQTALMEEGSVLVRQLIIESLLEGFIEPVLTGKKIPGLPQEDFNTVRRDMYRTLIDKYTERQEEKN